MGSISVKECGKLVEEVIRDLNLAKINLLIACAASSIVSLLTLLILFLQSLFNQVSSITSLFNLYFI
jgi:hypothetical protein